MIKLDAVKKLSKILWKGLDYKTTYLLEQRVDAMVRTLRFLKEQNNDNLVLRFARARVGKHENESAGCNY